MFFFLFIEIIVLTTEILCLVNLQSKFLVANALQRDCKEIPMTTKRTVKLLDMFILKLHFEIVL